MKRIYTMAEGDNHYRLSNDYCGLRDQAIGMAFEENLRGQEGPIAMLMEMGRSKGVATLLVAVDGTTSIYFSSGGGIIGAGRRPVVHESSKVLMNAVTGAVDQFELTSQFPLPRSGRVRFYVLLAGAARTADASDEDLGRSNYPLSPIFHKCQAVITAIRKSE